MDYSALSCSLICDDTNDGNDDANNIDYFTNKAISSHMLNMKMHKFTCNGLYMSHSIGRFLGIIEPNNGQKHEITPPRQKKTDTKINLKPRIGTDISNDDELKFVGKNFHPFTDRTFHT